LRDGAGRLARRETLSNALGARAFPAVMIPSELVAHLHEVPLVAAPIDEVGDEVLRVPIPGEALQEFAPP